MRLYKPLCWSVGWFVCLSVGRCWLGACNLWQLALFLWAKREKLTKISHLLDSSTLYPSRVVYHSTVTLRGALGVTVRYCTTLGGGQGRMNQKYLTSDRFQVTALPMKEPTKQDMVMLLVLLVALGF